MIDKAKKIIRKKAIANVNEKIAYLQKKPSDYVIATGIQYSVKDFINTAGKILEMEIEWSGKDLNVTGSWNGKKIISLSQSQLKPI